MKGDTKVIAYLNQILVNELTAINQYFHHAQILEDWGITELAKHEEAESLEERGHAKRLAQRIIFLGGQPQFGQLNPLRIGDSLEAILQNDLAMEIEAVDELKEAMQHCHAVGDFVSQDMLKDILADEEHHVDGLETQLDLLKRMGEPNYVAAHYDHSHE